MLVRQATLEDLDQMTALIQATSKKLIEKNVYQWAYPCELNELEHQITNGEVYILEDQKRMIGSFSIKPVTEEFPVQIEEGMYVYRMLIHPFYQGKNMTNHIFKHLRKEYKKKPVLVDCMAGNEKLSKFYLEHQCLHLGDYPEADYKISVFQVSKKGRFLKDHYGNFKKY
jgi:N-acetylglutamate synthase-like GNAT family acetyltransferase